MLNKLILRSYARFSAVTHDILHFPASSISEYIADCMNCLIEICQHTDVPGSNWEIFLGYVSLSVWVLYISAALWFLLDLDWHSALYNLGLYLNVGLGKLLKVLIAVPRPGPCPAPGYAFPSLHVMSVAFVAAYLFTTAILLSTQSPTQPKGTAWVFAWPHFRRRSVTLSRVRFWFYTLLALTLTVFVMISRVQLNYHTTGQAFAGLGLGLAAGAGWCFAALALYNRQQKSKGSKL